MDIDTIDEIMRLITTGKRTGYIDAHITELEAVYLTEKILKLPSRLTATTRKTIGERILKAIWKGEIQGDTESINW